MRVVSIAAESDAWSSECREIARIVVINRIGVRLILLGGSSGLALPGVAIVHALVLRSSSLASLVL